MLDKGLDSEVIMAFVASLYQIFLPSTVISEQLLEGKIQYNLFRHKILHGDIINPFYGTKNNMIRLICCLNCIFEGIYHIERAIKNDVE